MTAIYGSIMFIGILFIVTSGLMGKTPKGHKIISGIVLLMALIHAITGWIQTGLSYLPPLIVGTLMVVLLLINILAGMQKIKLSLLTHRINGIIILILALMHASRGILSLFGK